MKKFVSIALLSALSVISITSAASAEQVPARESQSSISAISQSSNVTLNKVRERHVTIAVGQAYKLPTGYTYVPQEGWPDVISLRSNGRIVGESEGEAVVQVLDGDEVKYLYYITVE